MNNQAKLAAVAATIGAIVRIVKSEAINGIITKIGLAPIPKPALPWLALALGAVAGLVQSMAQGQPISGALPLVIEGLVSGALAVGAHEALGVATLKVSPKVAGVAFGKTLPPPAPVQAEEEVKS